MGNTEQVNVRVAAADRPLIVALAQRLRRDAGFRERVAAFLENEGDSSLAERVKRLEQQVSRLVSGAIIVPRATVDPLPLRRAKSADPA